MKSWASRDKTDSTGRRSEISQIFMSLPHANNTPRWVDLDKDLRSRVENAPNILFPNHTKYQLTPSLALEQYRGTYYSPGYQNMTLVRGKSSYGTGVPTLLADHQDFTWQTRMEFRHISGEYWVMYSEMLRAP